MAGAAGIINKLNSLLNKYMPLVCVVYKRRLVRSGGDDLIGRPTSVTHVDVQLTPQPYYERLEGGRLDGLLKDNISVAVGDYAILFSPDSITLDDLRNKDLVVVLKDSADREEVLRLLSIVPTSINSVNVAYQGYFRSIKR